MNQTSTRTRTKVQWKVLCVLMAILILIQAPVVATQHSATHLPTPIKVSDPNTGQQPTASKGGDANLSNSTPRFEDPKIGDLHRESTQLSQSQQKRTEDQQPTSGLQHSTLKARTSSTPTTLIPAGLIGQSQDFAWDETNFVDGAPPDIVITTYQQVTDLVLATATGGVTPYVYTIRPPLPAGLTLDSSTGTISGLTAEVAPSQVHTLFVRDSNNSIQSTNVSIQTNTSPELIRIPDQLTLQTEGQFSTLLLDVARYVIDADNDQLTYTVTAPLNGPISVTPDPERDHLFTLSANNAGVGSQVTITATDPHGQILTQVIPVVVETSEAPEYVGGFPDSNDEDLQLGDLENQWLRIDTAFTDPNSDEALTFSVTPGHTTDPQPVLMNVVDPFPLTRFLACAPSTSCPVADDLTATITATDSSGKTADFVLNYDLIPHASQPTLNYPNPPITLAPLDTLNMVVGEEVTFRILDYFDDYEADIITDPTNTKPPLMVTVVGMNPEVLTHTLTDLSGVASEDQIYAQELTLTAVGTGPSTQTVTVTESFGSSPATASMTFVAVATSPFRFSSEIPAAIVGTVGEQFNLSLPAATGGTESYTYSLQTENLPEGITYTEDTAATPPTRVLSGTFTTPTFGIDTVEYTVTDADNFRIRHQIRFMVQSVIDPLRWNETSFAGISMPNLDRLPTLFFHSWESVDTELAQAVGGTAPYSYAVTSALPYGLAVDSQTARLSGSALEGFSDGYFTLEVTDSSDPPATRTIEIPLSVNTIPLIENRIENMEVPRGVERVLDLTGSFSDPDGDELAIEVEVNQGNSVALTKPGTQPRWNLDPQALGETVLRVTATDTNGGVATYDLTVTVSMGSAPKYYGDLETPFISAPLPTGEGYLYIPFTHMFSDPDEGDEITITVDAVTPSDGLSTLTDITPMLTTTQEGVSFCASANPCTDNSEFDLLITATDLSLNQTTGRARIRIDTDNTAPEYDVSFRANADLSKIYPTSAPMNLAAVNRREVNILLNEYFFVISQPVLDQLEIPPGRGWGITPESSPGVAATDHSVAYYILTRSFELFQIGSHGVDGELYYLVSANYEGKVITSRMFVRFSHPIVVPPIATQILATGGRNQFELPPASGGSETGFDYSVSDLPAGYSFDPASRIVTGSVPSDAVDNRYRTFTYTASDRSFPDNQANVDVRYRLAHPQPLALETDPIQPISVPNNGGAVDIPVTLPIYGIAPYSFAISPDLPTGLSLDANSGHITGTPEAPVNAQHYRLSVTDSNVPPETISRKVLVGINAPPVWNNPLSQVETALGTIQWLNLVRSFSDNEDDTVTFALSATSGTERVTITPDPNNDGVWSVTHDAVGSATIQIVATDSTGSVATYSYDVNIVANSSAPTFVAPIPADTETSNDYKLLLDFDADSDSLLLPLSVFQDDDPGESLTYTFQSSQARPKSPANTEVFNSNPDFSDSSQQFVEFCKYASGTPTCHAGYSFTLTLTATDRGGTALSKTITIDLEETHPIKPRVFQNISDMSLTIGDQTSFDITDYINHIEQYRSTQNQPDLTFAVTSNNAGVITTPTITGDTLAFTAEAAGSTDVSITATIGSETATDTFTVSVVDGPQLATIEQGLVWETETPTELLLPLATGGASPYTYSLQPELPAGLRLEERTFAGQERSYIVGSPTEIAGAQRYRWTATDSNGVTNSVSFDVTIDLIGTIRNVGKPLQIGAPTYRSFEGDPSQPPHAELGWGQENPHHSGISHYELERRVVGTEDWALVDTLPYDDGRSRSWVDRTGSPGVNYEWRISARLHRVGQPFARVSSSIIGGDTPFPSNSAWTATEPSAYLHDRFGPDQWLSSQTSLTDTLWRLTGPTDLIPGDQTPSTFRVVKQDTSSTLVGGHIPSAPLTIVDPSDDLSFTNVSSVTECTVDFDVCLIGRHHVDDDDDTSSSPSIRIDFDQPTDGGVSYATRHLEDRRIYDTDGIRRVDDQGGTNDREVFADMVPWTTFDLEVFLNPATDFSDHELQIGWDAETPVRGQNKQLEVNLDNTPVPLPTPSVPDVTTSGNLVSLTWDTPTDYPTNFITAWEYRVQDADGTNNVIDWTPFPGGGTATSGDIAGIVGGVSYRFQLRARNSVAGPFSETVATPPLTPAAPPVISAQASTGTITLTWEPIPDNGNALTATQYRYKRSDSSTWTAWTAITDPTGRTAEITGLTDDVTYDVEIRGVSQIGDGTAKAISLAPPNGMAVTNRPPRAADVNNLSVTLTPIQSKTLTLSELFTEPDGQNMTFTWEDGMDSVATITQPTPGTLSLAGVAVGTFTAQIVATDTEDVSGRRSLTVTVGPNLPPSVSTATTEVSIPEETTQTIDLSTIFTDPNGDSLNFEVSQVDAEFLETVTVDQANQQLSVTTKTVECASTGPPCIHGFSSPTTFSVTATDPGSEQAEASVRVSITNVNQPPVVVGDSTISVNVPANHSTVVDLADRFSDPDRNPLHFSLENYVGDTTKEMAATVSLSDSLYPQSLDLTLVGLVETLPDGQGRDYFEVRVVANDGLATASIIVQISVVPNHLPNVLRSGDQTVTVTAGESISFDLSTVLAHPTTGRDLQYTQSGGDSSVATVSITGNQAQISGVVAGSTTFIITGINPDAPANQLGTFDRVELPLIVTVNPEVPQSQPSSGGGSGGDGGQSAPAAGNGGQGTPAPSEPGDAGSGNGSQPQQPANGGQQPAVGNGGQQPTVGNGGQGNVSQNPSGGGSGGGSPPTNFGAGTPGGAGPPSSAAPPVAQVSGTSFTDSVGTTHEANINRLAEGGITRGCNPPENSRFCPDRAVTRGEMATFMVRAFDLTSSSSNLFGDDDGNTHEANINALAAAEITRGCNPPENSRYCPDRPVTRAQMATFLARAMELADGTGDFSDTNNSPHANDINRIASVGITRGCNPPTNSRYCPDRAVTRGEMATFLIRAEDLSGS